MSRSDGLALKKKTDRSLPLNNLISRCMTVVNYAVDDTHEEESDDEGKEDDSVSPLCTHPYGGGQPTYMCSDETDMERKLRVLKTSPAHLFTSKKMNYSAFVKVSPGMTTFANKKRESVKDTVEKKQLCFRNKYCSANNIH